MRETRTEIDGTPLIVSTAASCRPLGEKEGRVRDASQAGKAGPKTSCSKTWSSPAKKTSGQPVPSGVLIDHHPDSGVRQERVEPPTVALTYQAADPMGSCPASRKSVVSPGRPDRSVRALPPYRWRETENEVAPGTVSHTTWVRSRVWTTVALSEAQSTTAAALLRAAAFGAGLGAPCTAVRSPAAITRGVLPAPSTGVARSAPSGVAVPPEPLVAAAANDRSSAGRGSFAVDVGAPRAGVVPAAPATRPPASVATRARRARERVVVVGIRTPRGRWRRSPREL